MCDKPLKYFLDNKNFTKTKGRKHQKEKSKDVLEIIDGKIVLAEAPKEETEDQITTAYTYLTKKSGKKRWSEHETSVFYRAIECCGFDFSMINLLFPDKDRSNIKFKYKRENKINPSKMENAIKNFTKFNITKFNHLKEEIHENN